MSSLLATTFFHVSVSPNSVRICTSCCGDPIFVLRGQRFSLSPTLVWQVIPSSATFKPFSRWAAIKNKWEGVSTSQTGGRDAPSSSWSFYWAHSGSTLFYAGRKTAYFKVLFPDFPPSLQANWWKCFLFLPSIHTNIKHLQTANSNCLCWDATVCNGCDECQIAEFEARSVIVSVLTYLNPFGFYGSAFAEINHLICVACGFDSPLC